MTRTVKYKYNCHNDCIQTGCPGHEMELNYSTISDTIELVTLGHKDKNGEWVNNSSKFYDKSELGHLARAWQELRDKI